MNGLNNFDKLKISHMTLNRDNLLIRNKSNKKGVYKNKEKKSTFLL